MARRVVVDVHHTPFVVENYIAKSLQSNDYRHHMRGRDFTWIVVGTLIEIQIQKLTVRLCIQIQKK